MKSEALDRLFEAWAEACVRHDHAACLRLVHPDTLAALGSGDGVVLRYYIDESFRRAHPRPGWDLEPAAMSTELPGLDRFVPVPTHIARRVREVPGHSPVIAEVALFEQDGRLWFVLRDEDEPTRERMRARLVARQDELADARIVAESLPDDVVEAVWLDRESWKRMVAIGRIQELGVDRATAWRVVEVLWAEAPEPDHA